MSPAPTARHCSDGVLPAPSTVIDALADSFPLFAVTVVVPGAMAVSVASVPFATTVAMERSPVVQPIGDWTADREAPKTFAGKERTEPTAMGSGFDGSSVMEPLPGSLFPRGASVVAAAPPSAAATARGMSVSLRIVWEGGWDDRAGPLELPTDLRKQDGTSVSVEQRGAAA
jgi:hypothetical protein